ncbi:MAG TPA: alpha/beta hydrolase-fold protein [Acidimicrobiales bacterium]|nr:alpha/beta hydrolase-fold protein [Acidimicrobiales bacterium]
MSQISIVSPWFIAAVAALSVLAGWATWRNRRRPVVRIATAGLSIVLVTSTAAASINAYYEYIPRVADLTGRSARLGVSTARARRLAWEAGLPDPVRPRQVLTHGIVEHVDIPPTVSHFRARRAQVYLPPAWFATPRPALPVLELLHGTPGSPNDWTRGAGIDVMVDEWAGRHAGVAPIVVMPDVNGSFTADTECTDGVAGNAESYLAVDVPAWTIASLGASPDRASWAIGGLSEGGFCSVLLSLRHADRYATSLDFGGLDEPTWHGGALRLLHGSRAALLAHQPSFLFSHMRSGPPIAFWFEDGHHNVTTPAVADMSRMAARNGFQNKLVLLPSGRHTFRLWHRCMSDALDWTMGRLGLTA